MRGCGEERSAWEPPRYRRWPRFPAFWGAPPPEVCPPTTGLSPGRDSDTSCGTPPAQGLLGTAGQAGLGRGASDPQKGDKGWGVLHAGTERHCLEERCPQINLPRGSHRQGINKTRLGAHPGEGLGPPFRARGEGPYPSVSSGPPGVASRSGDALRPVSQLGKEGRAIPPTARNAAAHRRLPRGQRLGSPRPGWGAGELGSWAVASSSPVA